MAIKNFFQNFRKHTTFHPGVTISSVSLLLILTLVCAIYPDRTNDIFSRIQAGIYDNLSWVYILLVSFFLIFLIVLAFSKVGKIRLGADNSTPQYGFFPWVAMLFAAGMGIGLMYFGVAEPMSHYVNPALPDMANPAKEAQLATFFHWGLHAWGIYALMGLILAYFSFRYKLPLLVRSGFYPILKDRINGPIGSVIDVFTLISTFFGIATSLAFGVLQLNAGLVHLGVLNDSNVVVQCVIILVVTSIAVLSAMAGVNKGVKRLSEINLVMAIVLMVFVLVLGPTTFLLSAFSEGIGYYINQLANLTFRTFAFEQDGQEWFTGWTVMYWAWWISWAPFVGLFIARISRGRTIREYILAVLLVPTLFIFLWMTVFGNGAIYMDQHTAGGALSALADNPDVLLFAFFEQLPLARPVCVIALMMILIFFITSADSGIMVMNGIASANRPNPPKWQNVFWGVLLVMISIAMLYAGGLDSLQTMTLLFALPFSIIMLLLSFCLLKALRTDTLYSSARVPYGSKNWDGTQWEKKLKQILTFSQKSDIIRFFDENVEPAFDELKKEFEKNGIIATIQRGRQGKLSVELIIPHEQIWNFKYGVTAEKRTISDYLIQEDNTPDIQSTSQYVPITYFADGRAGNDIQYLNKDEIIADVLREYERYISIIADEQHSMMFIDKSNNL